METREWALIAFTILTQMSVGAFIVLGIMHFYAQRKGGLEQADQLADRALLAIVPTLALGMLASLLHLGTPLNAWKTIFNVGSSWLSREILFSVLFVGVAAVFAFMQWRKMYTPQVRNIVALVSVALGLLLIYANARAYMTAAVPLWNSWFTLISFLTTAFLLGALAMGAALVANYAYMQRKDPGCADAQCTLLRDVLRWVAVIAVTLLGVEFLVVPLQIASLASSGSVPALESVNLMAGTYQWVLILRLALVFIGAGILGAFVYSNASSPGKERVAGNLTYLAFLFVLVGEVLGRFLFFASFAKFGIL